MLRTSQYRRKQGTNIPLLPVDIALKRHGVSRRNILKAHVIETVTKFKKFLPYVFFIVYLFLGSAVLYVIERIFEPNFKFSRIESVETCIVIRGYWAAFSYVISATSTIACGMFFTHLRPDDAHIKPVICANKRASSFLESAVSSVAASTSENLDTKTEFSLPFDELKSQQSVASRRSRIHAVCSKHKTAILYLAFLGYLLLGAGLLLGIESIFQRNMSFARPSSIDECMGNRGYWSAVAYVIAAASTIGFGNAFPCTDVGRAVSTIYSIFGIPMVVYILSNFGSQLCAQMMKLYPRVKRFFSKKHQNLQKRSAQRKLGQQRPLLLSNLSSCDGIKEFNLLRQTIPTEINDNILLELSESQEQTTEKEEYIEESTPDIPTTIGVILTLMCVACIAAFYGNIENYDREDAIFYAFMTFLGGDFVTQKFLWVVPVYVMIFLGFSMLSLTISIFQSNMEKFINSVKTRLMENVMNKIEEAKNMSQDPSNIDVDGAVADALRDAAGPWWMKSAFPQAQIDRLRDTVATAVNRNDKSTQEQLVNEKRILIKADSGVQSEAREGVSQIVQSNELADATTFTEGPCTLSRGAGASIERKDVGSFTVQRALTDFAAQQLVDTTGCGQQAVVELVSTAAGVEKDCATAATQTFFEGYSKEVQASLKKKKVTTPSGTPTSSRRTSVQSK